MTAATDLADMRMRGERLDPDAAEPVTPTAERNAEDERRLYTLRRLLSEADRDIRSDIRGVTGATTGHWELDRDTGGLTPGHVWIFGAETNWGKSSFLLSVADENLRLGRRVLIVTVEDPPKMFGERLLVRRAELNAMRAKNRSLNAAERQRSIEVAARSTTEPVLLDARDRSVEWAAKQTKNKILEHDVDVVLFDYLHAFDSEKPGQKSTDRRLQVNYIARTLTNVVKSTNRSGIIFAQLTVEEGKRPTKYSIRDSRDVANAAEVVVLGWTPPKTVASPSGETLVKEGQRAFILDKNKSGPAGRIYGAKWNEGGAYFEAVSDPMDEFNPARDALPEWEDDA